MATTSINCLASVLKELQWSYGKLIAELRRHAAVDGIMLPQNESLIPSISRWVNNHQQPDDFYRELLSRATGRQRFELFSDEAAVVLQVASESSGIARSVAVGSDEDMNRRQLLARAAALSAALAADPLHLVSGVTPRAGDALLEPRSVPAGIAEREIVAAIRQVLLGYGSPLVTPPNDRPDIRGLDRRVYQAWKLRQGSHYLELGRVLPQLLADAQVASHELAGDQQAVAFGLLAHSYNTVSSALRKLGDNGLAVIAADRAVQAAKTVGEPLLVAASSYRLANAFLPAGRVVEAKEVAISAAGGLETDLDTSAAHLATWGGLLLTAATAVARQGDSGEAWELVGEAKAAARRLGTDHVDHADLHIIFGPTSLAIQGVQVAAELGDGREVLRRSKLVEPTRLPSYLVERRSHYLIDVARGHAHRVDDPGALAMLLEAERLAPEEVRYNPIASELVMVLLRRERRAAMPGLRDLSARIGLVA
jgi:hypothetical protein